MREKRHQFRENGRTLQFICTIAVSAAICALSLSVINCSLPIVPSAINTVSAQEVSKKETLPDAYGVYIMTTSGKLVEILHQEPTSALMRFIQGTNPYNDALGRLTEGDREKFRNMFPQTQYTRTPGHYYLNHSLNVKVSIKDIKAICVFTSKYAIESVFLSRFESLRPVPPEIEAEPGDKVFDTNRGLNYDSFRCVPKKPDLWVLEFRGNTDFFRSESRPWIWAIILGNEKDYYPFEVLPDVPSPVPRPTPTSSSPTPSPK